MSAYDSPITSDSAASVPSAGQQNKRNLKNHLRPETTMEHAARCMAEGIFPQKDEPKMVDAGYIKYLGWEIHRHTEWMPIQAGCEWDAYRGGVDLDAPRISGRTLDEVADEIDEYELERLPAENERLRKELADARRAEHLTFMDAARINADADSVRTQRDELLEAMQAMKGTLRKLQPALNLMARDVLDDIIKDQIDTAIAKASGASASEPAPPSPSVTSEPQGQSS